jgi:hypothetical protein
MESRSPLGLTWSPIQWIPGTSSPGIERLGHAAGHLIPRSAEVSLHDRDKYIFHIFLHQPPSCTETTARSPSEPPSQYFSTPYSVCPLFLSSLLANLFTAILLMLSTHKNRFGLDSVGAGASKAFKRYFFLSCSVWLELSTHFLLGF